MRLSRKSSFIVVIVIASLLIGGLIGFYFYTRNANKAPKFLGQTEAGRSLGYNPSINTPPTSTSTNNIEIPVGPVVVPKLRHITNQAVAGGDFVFVDILATTTKNIEPPDLSLSKLAAPKKIAPKVALKEERFRWIERGTGHIFETTSTSMDVARLSNTTVTKVVEAFFTNNGDSLILRDLVGSTDTIRTRFATLTFETPTSTEQVLKTTDLPVDITQIARSPDRGQIFSVMDSGMRGILSNTDGGSKVGIFDTPIKEWLVQWPNKQTILLTTKPSGATAGFSYSINPQTRSFSRILGGINGLTTLMSPDGEKVLYSQSESGSVKLFSYDRKTGASTDMFLRTFPEKCVWSPVEKSLIYCGLPADIAFNLYPDVWYQGRIVFSDSIWSINVDTLETHLLVTPTDEVGTIIDVINPELNSTGDYMVFQNKIDLSLWGLQTKEPQTAPFNPFNASAAGAKATTTAAI